MKVAWWCVFFLLFCNVAYSQAIELTGAIIIGKTEMMSYRIVYSINSKNEISGYSIADLGGDLETKSRISGMYNPAKKALRFEETAILSTKAKLSASDFCLMSVNGKFERKAGKNVFTGNFVSKSGNDKLVCESGTIILTTTKEIYKAAAKASQAIDKLPATDSLTREIKARLNPLKGVEKVKTLTSGNSEEYTLSDDVVQFDIFDDKLEDGDVISILKNNTTILNQLKTTNKVQSFRFVVRADEKAATFTIVANNEGTSPPNTVKIVMTNGKTKELLISQLSKNQRVKLIFKRK